MLTGMGDQEQDLETCANGTTAGNQVTPVVIDDNAGEPVAIIEAASTENVDEVPAETVRTENETETENVDEVPAETVLTETETETGMEITTVTAGVQNGNDCQLVMDDNDGRTQEERDRQRLKALEWLRQAVGNPEADFHEGQWEAIDAVANRHQRVVVIQRTGWGKSSVYFIATRILREEQKRGPTLIISPLLALMRNQVDSAGKLGIRSATLNSSNPKEWEQITADILDDKVRISVMKLQTIIKKTHLFCLRDAL